MRIGKKPVMRFWRRENTKKNCLHVKSVRCLLLIALLALLPGCGTRSSEPLTSLEGNWYRDPFYHALMLGMPFDRVTDLRLDYSFADGRGIAHDATSQERKVYEQTTGYAAPDILRCVTKQTLSDLLQLRLGHPLSDFQEPEWFAIEDTYYFAGGMEYFRYNDEIAVTAEAASRVSVQRTRIKTSDSELHSMSFEQTDGVYYPDSFLFLRSTWPVAPESQEEALNAYRSFLPALRADQTGLEDLLGGAYLNGEQLVILLSDMERKEDLLALFDAYEPVIQPCQYTKKALELLVEALMESLPCDALNGIGVDEIKNRVFIDLHGAAEYAPQVWDLVKGLPVELQWGPPLSAYHE